jgi:hypothetical protein
MKSGSSTAEKALLVTGAFFILSGIVLNEKTLAALFSTDGSVAAPHRLVIWVLDLLSVSLGCTVIIFRKRLTRDTLLVIAGSLFVLAGVLFNEQFLSVLLNLEMTPMNKIIVRVFELYLISTGLLTVLFRKSFRLKNVLLYLFFTPDSRLHIYNVHVEDKYLGWKPKAGSTGRHIYLSNFDVEYVMDENGYRKIQNTENPDLSIYFFGDSFTFGQGVSNGDTFPDIIKDRYVTKRVNVYNAGVLGYGIVQMYQRFLNMEDRIKPGDLIVFTPLSQDIERNLKDFYMPYLLSFFYEKLEYYPAYDHGVVRSYKLKNNIFNFLKLLVLKAPYTGNVWTSIYKKFIPDTTKEAIEIMNIVRERTEARGGRFYLFFLPNIEECLQGRYTNDTAGFDYFDIMRYFPSQKKELDRIRFKYDKHWNVHGHEIAAKAIIETLRDKGLLDQKYLR